MPPNSGRSVEQENGGKGQGQLDLQAVEPPVLSPEETEQRARDLNKLYNISMIRESAHPQFDGMGYMKYNETNEMADISFLPRKVNKQDSRITSGITHEKVSSILSLIEGFNFEGQVHIFYKDEEMYDLSTAMTAWVRKSREQERYDEKRPVLYRNLLAQGTAFAMEKWIERWVPDKAVDLDTIDFANLDETKWSLLGDKKVYEGAEICQMDGKKVFLEDIRQWDIRKQPGVYMVEYVPRELVESIWGKSKRWKNVPKKCTSAMSIGQMITNGSIYSEWLFGPIEEDKMEIIHVCKQFENRYQIYINGVPMLAKGFPLTVLSPSGLVPVAKGDIDIMNMFAYSKSIPAKTKIDQAVYDAVIKGLNIKFQQGFMGARANMSDMAVNATMFMPGMIIDDLDPKSVPLLIDPNQSGISNGDMSFYKMLQENIDSKSINAILEGGGANTTTLGEYLDKQKKAMLKVGRVLDAVINWEKQMTHLRTINLIVNGTKPKEEILLNGGLTKRLYDDVSVSEPTEEGKMGTHVIRFTEDNTVTPQDLEKQEEDYEAQTGNKIKYSSINPQLLRKIITDQDYCFYYDVVPVDKNNDKLSQAAFIGAITQAQQVFGPQSLNVEKLKRRYAAVMGEEFDTLFLDDQAIALQQQQQAAMMPGMPASGDNPNGKPLANPYFQ